MTKVVNHQFVAEISENVTAAERKLRLIQQYINPETGTIDAEVVKNLYFGAMSHMDEIRDLIRPFL